LVERGGGVEIERMLGRQWGGQRIRLGSKGAVTAGQGDQDQEAVRNAAEMTHKAGDSLLVMFPEIWSKPKNMTRRMAFSGRPRALPGRVAPSRPFSAFSISAFQLYPHGHRPQAKPCGDTSFRDILLL